MLLVAGNEGELVDLAVQLGQRKLDAGDAVAGEQRQGAILLRLQVVQCDAGEVGNNHVARHLVLPALANQVLDILERLRLGLAQVLPSALVFDQQHTPPEEVDAAVPARNLPHRLLERGNGAAAHPEHFKEVVPERLFFAALAPGGRPFLGEGDGVLADFVPRNGHGLIPSLRIAGRLPGCRYRSTIPRTGRWPPVWPRKPPADRPCNPACLAQPML